MPKFKKDFVDFLKNRFLFGGQKQDFVDFLKNRFKFGGQKHKTFVLHPTVYVQTKNIFYRLTVLLFNVKQNLHTTGAILPQVPA